MILADNREPATLLQLLPNVKIARLPTGDYITENTCIERKTVSDYLLSMRDGRLTDQLNKLRTFTNRYLIIEGIFDWNTLSTPELFLWSLQQAVLTGTPVLFTRDHTDTAKVLQRIEKTALRERHWSYSTGQLQTNSASAPKPRFAPYRA